MTVRLGVRFCVALAVCSLLATGASLATGTAAADTATAQNGQITIRDVTLDRTTVESGETVTVEGILENSGDETTGVEVTLTVDGEVVETRTATAVQPGFPVIASVEWTPSEPGTYQLAINGVEAPNELVVEGDESGGSETDESNGQRTDPTQFSVRNVSLQKATIRPGETTTVIAGIGNDGDEQGDYEATLEVNGEAVRTKTVPKVLSAPEVGAQAYFDYTPEEAGNYTISVGGVEANRQLVAEESGGGGGLFGFLGVLGFLPLGLLRTALLFLGLPILVIYLALKGLALYLGY